MPGPNTWSDKSISAQSRERPWHLWIVMAKAKISGNCTLYTKNFFKTRNLLFTFSTLYSSDMWSNFTLMCPTPMWVTTPMAPFTRPRFVSMFLRNITRAPTAMRSVDSKPAVRFGSALSLCSSLAARLPHRSVPVVSSTWSLHCTSTTLECRRLSMSLLNWSHDFLVGNRHTGVWPHCKSWTKWSTTSQCISLSFSSVRVLSDGQPRRTSSNTSAYCLSLFWRSLIVNSS